MASVGDPHDLARFLDAQADVIDAVRAELAAGSKRSHWMWFVFPQLCGLGLSAMAERYGIGSRAEAIAYLAHPILGARLVECTRLVLATRSASALEIFGKPDDLKFRSSMTLFADVDPGAGAGDGDTAPSPFPAALDRFFEGEPDPRTLALLGGS